MIIAANHASIFDPPLLAYCLARGGLRAPFALGKEELFRNPVSRWVLSRLYAIPLDRGRGDVGALKKALEVLEREECLLLFPEGTRARGRVLRPKPGIGFLAAQSGCPVVPARVWGTEAYPRETARVKFGPPRRFEAGAGKDGYQKVADEVMSEIRSMSWD